MPLPLSHSPQKGIKNTFVPGARMLLPKPLQLFQLAGFFEGKVSASGHVLDKYCLFKISDNVVNYDKGIDVDLFSLSAGRIDHCNKPRTDGGL